MAVDYTENIMKMTEINEEEKEFLITYFNHAHRDLKRCYRAQTNEYKRWHRWLKKHDYLIWKIEHQGNLALVRNSKEAFEFVLNECIDMAYNAKQNKNSKARIQALNLISKICGLEQYATAQIQQLSNASKQNDLAKLTTEQLKQLAYSVRENMTLLQQNAENTAEESDDVSSVEII